MKRFYLLIFFVASTIILTSQVSQQNISSINWLSVNEALILQKENPKTVLLYINDENSGWCEWCNKMETETLNNPEIANYINTNFYSAKFDIYSKDTITFKNKIYTNTDNVNKSIHQLTKIFMKEPYAYPTLVYIDNEFSVSVIPGYMDAKTIEPLLVYFAENIHKNSEYPDFLKDYKNTFYPEESLKNKGSINWVSINDIDKKMQLEPKKIFLFINSKYNNSSLIMSETVLKQPIISDYINENFYPVFFDYDSSDTINFAGSYFINELNIKGYPNQLSIALLQQNIIVPSIVFFDKNFSIIVPLRGYFSTKTIEAYIEYINDEAYIKQPDWIKFYESFKSKIKE